MNDLAADLSAELAPPPAAVSARPAAPAPQAERRAVPAVAVVLTPLHWVRPSVGSPPGGAGVLVRGGPWQVSVLL